MPGVTSVAGFQNQRPAPGSDMDSLITAAARALAAGDPLGALKTGRPARRRAGAGASRHRDGAAGRSGAGQGAPAERRSRLRSERGCGSREVPGRRSRDRARLARFELAGEVARCGSRDARSAWRPAERRARALPRGAAPPADRSPRGGRAHARAARPHEPSARVEGRSRVGSCRDRDAAPPNQGSARCARPRRGSPRARPISPRSRPRWKVRPWC